MSEWLHDDLDIPDSEGLFRRIKKTEQCRTLDPVRGVWVLSAGALRREAYEGMSVHLQSVLDDLGRDITTLYPIAEYGSVRFEAAVPRSQGAGIRSTPAEGEPDPDLREAHGDVFPPQPQKDRNHWRAVVNEIAVKATWVQSPE